MTKTPALLCLLCLLCLSAPVLADGTVYQAVLDGRIHALATLRSDHGQTHGQVYYEASGADGLELTGQPAPPGGFDWRESLWSRDDGDRKPTGSFTGKLGADGKSGQGVWKSADGKKTLPLTLTRLAILHALADREVDAQVDYPQFDDAHFTRLNQQLADTARKQQAEQVESIKEQRKELADIGSEALDRLSASTTCDVESAQPALVSLLCTVYEYSGGAHGMSGPDARNYALSPDGAVKTLGLWDVLRKSPATVKKLSALILADLKRQRASLVVDGSVKGFVKELDRGEQAFTVVPAGLAFHFAPYAVATYAEGHFRAAIPNRALAGLYRADGPLAARNGQP